MNFDVSLFKNFQLGETRKLQFRAGFFNVFNQAFPGDIDLNLDTRCQVQQSGVPNGVGGTVDDVCDPTGGFSYTPQTLENFGKIITRRGRRVVEFALKFYF